MNKYRIILIYLLIASALADIITFFSKRLFAFEINPIYLLTKSVWLLVGVKIFVVCYLCYLIYSYKPRTNYLYGFVFVFCAVFAIIGQFFGACLNYDTIQAYEDDPVNTIPLQEEEAIHTFAVYNIIFLYFPMFLGFISFWFFERIYLEKERKKLKNRLGQSVK